MPIVLSPALAVIGSATTAGQAATDGYDEAEELLYAGRIAEAREQIWLAAALDESMMSERERWLRAHPLSETQRRLLETSARLFLDRRVEARREQLRSEQQQYRRAPGFSLPDLEGKRLSRGDLCGRVVVLDFRATWCGPSVAGLNELKKAWEDRSRDCESVAFVAISVDTRKDRVAPFVEKHGVPFRVPHADGVVDGEHVEGGGILQLYVLDRSGRIRFHVVGLDRERFLERLGWMIEAVLEKQKEFRDRGGRRRAARPPARRSAGG